MGLQWAEPVKKPILDVGRFAGVEPGIFWGIFFSAAGGADYGSALEAA
jgi:hypothetical protein